MLGDAYIAPDVAEELDNEAYGGRSHYSRATYALGCHGPLCRLAETHRGRRRSEARAKAADRDYRPNLTAREADREAELMAVVAQLNEMSRLRQAV